MSYDSIHDVDLEIIKQKKKLHDLELAKAEMLKDNQTNSEIGHLAVFLHNNLCRENHVDGCSWHYEISKNIHQWDGSAHSHYWKVANKLIKKGYRFDAIQEIISIIKEY